MHELIESIPLFEGLTLLELQTVADCFHEWEVEPGQVIFSQGDVPDAFYVVSSGRVEIFMTGEGAAEQVLATLGVGSFFGEMGLIEDAPRMASARAVDAGMLLVVYRQEFQQVIDAHPTLALRIRSAIMRRHRQNVSTILDE